MAFRYFLLVCCPLILFALPQNPVVTAGNAEWAANGNEMSIDVSDCAVIEWDNFSIQEQEAVYFNQPQATSSVLNRVMDASPSHILGILKSNGQVILINPNGILFGKEARVDVGNLIASTLDLQDRVFKLEKGRTWREEGKIEVCGSIRANEVSLLGRYIDLQDGCLLSASSNHGGGKVNINGEFLHIQPLAYLEADALSSGDGGQITIWGDEKTVHLGTISAQGGSLGGKGGFVEVSGKFLDFSGTVKAPQGTLLIDPMDLSISGNPNNNVTGGSPFMPVASTSCGPSTGAATFSDLNNVILSGILDGGTNVIVSTAGTVGLCLGDIFVLAPVTWGATNPASLTLIAERSIIVRSSISATNAGASPISLTANTGDITIDAITPAAGVAVENVNGVITASAPSGSVNVLGGPGANNFAAIGQTAQINSNGNIDVTAGVDLVIQGGAGMFSYASIGRFGILPAALAVTAVGDLNICVGNRCNIYGGSGPRADAFIGHSTISLLAICLTTVTSNFNINVGHILDVMSGSTTGGAYIGQGSGIQIDGDFIINVGEYLYLHNNLTNIGAFSTFIGNIEPGPVFCVQPAIARQNLYLNVGKNLTLDSRTVTNTGGAVFISIKNVFPNLTTEGIQKIHVGGDINCIAGTQKALIHTLFTLGSGPPVNEVFVGGSIRCYNGDPSAFFAYAFIIADNKIPPVIPRQDLGLTTIRTGGNFIQAGGTFSPNFLFSTLPIFIETDALFGPGQLWGPQSCIVNGANVFAGTPLAAGSANTGGNGLGGYAVDTHQYNCSPILFPSSVTGFVPIPNANPPCPGVPSFFGITGYITANDITLLSRDRFVDTTPCDLGIGFDDNDFIAYTGISSFNPPIGGNITIAGFRNINVHDGSQTYFRGDITLIAQNDITVGPRVAGFGSNDLEAAGNLILVADNQAPARPLIGGVWSPLGGKVVIDLLAELNSGTNGLGGVLRIYTARQSLNSILGSLNGVFFTLGTLFADTLLEQWCTYYPTPFNGLPFTIFYKECLQQVANQADIIVSEFLVDLHPYNEFPGWVSRFFIDYTRKRPEELPYEPYYLRRRNLKAINHPKSYTLFTE